MCLDPWKDPEINQIQTQNQGKQDEWPKETQKKYPIKGIQTLVRAWLSLSPSMCLSTCALFLLINTLLVSLLSISIQKFTFTHLMGQGLVTGHWSLVTGGLVVRIQHSHCHGLTSISGWELKPCFKLLQQRPSESNSQSRSVISNSLQPYVV